MKAWNVYKPAGHWFRHIDTVYFQPDMDAEEIKRSLVDHDRYPGNIVVKEG